MKFQYEWRDTPLHRMHPLSKIVIFFSIGTVFSSWMDFRYSLIGLLASLILWRISRVPRDWSKILLATIGAGWIGIVLWLPFQVRPRIFKVLPEEYALTPLLDLGTIPHLGRAVYTYGTVWIYLNSVIKGATMMTLSMILIYTTSPSDVTQMLLKWRVPNAVSFSFITFFRFSRVFSKAATNIVNSYRLRGWEGITSRNPIKFVRQMTPVMKAIGLQFIMTTNMLTLAVANRGFGTQRMPHKDLRLTTAEKTVMSASIVVGLTLFLLCVFPPYLGNI